MLNNEITYPAASSVQQTFDQIERELGAGLVPRIFKLLEPNPELLTHLWGQFRTLVLQGQLPRTLKEMVGLIVAIHTHCDYVQVIHMHSLTLQGISREALAALNSGDYTSGQLSTLTQNTLRFAALAVATRSAYGSDTDPAKWENLRQQTGQALSTSGLSDSEKVEVLATLALFEQICTVANVLGLDPTNP